MPFIAQMFSCSSAFNVFHFYCLRPPAKLLVLPTDNILVHHWFSSLMLRASVQTPTETVKWAIRTWAIPFIVPWRAETQGGIGLSDLGLGWGFISRNWQTLRRWSWWASEAKRSSLLFACFLFASSLLFFSCCRSDLQQQKTSLLKGLDKEAWMWPLWSQDFVKAFLFVA